MNFPYFISTRLSRESGSSFAKIISKLAVLSITLSLVTMILSYFILGGFKRTIEDKIYNLKGHLEITKYTLGGSYDDNYILNNSEFFTSLHDHEFVDHIQEFALKAGMIKTKQEVEGVGLKGVGRSFDTLRFEHNMVEGRFISFEDSGYSKEIVISKHIAHKMRLKLHDKVTMYFVQNPPKFRRLEVVGLYETGLEEIDKTMILGDLNMVRKLNNWENTYVGGIEVFVKPEFDIDQAEVILYEKADSYLYVDKVSDKYAQIFDWLSLLDQNVSIFLVLILLVASFNMISILLILIMERTYTVGVFQSLGADKKMIQKIFVYNGMKLVLQGMLLGNGIALFIAVIQDNFHLIPLDPVNYYMSFVPIYWDFKAQIYLNILTFVIILTSLMIPLTVITGIKPVKALKFD